MTCSTLVRPLRQAPALAAQRGCAGAAALGGQLYLAGGGVADVQYDTVEIFNAELDAWMPGAPLLFFVCVLCAPGMLLGRLMRCLCNRLTGD